MIGLPFNDHACLGTITEHVAGLVAARDPALVALAERYPTTALLIEYIRSRPQRDDLGDADDGPREDACTPSQRFRIPADDGNCLVMWSWPLCAAGHEPRRGMFAQLHITSDVITARSCAPQRA